MNVATGMKIITGNLPTVPASVRDKKIPAGATVSHDPATDCFSYVVPGQHYAVCRSNPLLVGLKAGATVGLPALLGAAEKQIFGTLGAGLGGTWAGLVGGIVLGAGIGFHQAYHSSKKNPMMGLLGGIAGATIGGVLLPVLKLPGAIGGLMGAAVSSGGAALGFGVWTAVSNHGMTQDAKAHGWTNP